MLSSLLLDALFGLLIYELLPILSEFNFYKLGLVFYKINQKYEFFFINIVIWKLQRIETQATMKVDESG